MKKVTDKEYKEIEVLHSKMLALYEQYKKTVNEINYQIYDLIDDGLTPIIDEFNETVDDLQNRVNGIYEEIEKAEPIPFGTKFKEGKRLDWSVMYNTVQWTNLDHIEIDVPLENIEIYDLPSQDFNE